MKNSSGFVLLLFTSLLFFECSSSEKLPKTKEKVEIIPNIKILEKTATNWVAGTQSGGVGVDYKIDLIVNIENVKFEYLCAQNASLDIKIVKGNLMLNNNYKVQKGDTLSIRSTLSSVMLVAICNDSLKDTESIIHYSIADSTGFTLSVKNMTQKESEPRP